MRPFLQIFWTVMVHFITKEALCATCPDGRTVPNGYHQASAAGGIDIYYRYLGTKPRWFDLFATCQSEGAIVPVFRTVEEYQSYSSESSSNSDLTNNNWVWTGLTNPKLLKNPPLDELQWLDDPASYDGSLDSILDFINKTDIGFCAGVFVNNLDSVKLQVRKCSQTFFHGVCQFRCDVTVAQTPNVPNDFTTFRGQHFHIGANRMEFTEGMAYCRNLNAKIYIPRNGDQMMTWAYLAGMGQFASFFPVLKFDPSVACDDLTACKPLVTWYDGTKFDDFGVWKNLTYTINRVCAKGESNTLEAHGNLCSQGAPICNYENSIIGSSISNDCNHFTEFNGKLYASTSETETLEGAKRECGNFGAKLATFKTLEDFRIVRNARGTK